MRILKDRSILVVIDIQERIFPVIHEHEMLQKNVPLLIRGMQAMDVPILVTEQYVRGLGATIAPVVEAFGSGARIEKKSFSCCDEPAFNMALATSGKENVIITGVESHVCVLQTAVDLKRQGFNPVVVEDCISSRRLNDKRIALSRMGIEGIRLATYESILFELLRYAGSDTFRAVTKLVK